MKKMYYSRILTLLLIICSGIFIYYIVNHDFLAFFYKSIIVLVIIILILLILKLSNSKMKIFRGFAGFAALMLTLSQALGIMFVSQLDSFLVQLGSQDKSLVNIYVKADSKLQLKDLENSKVGIVKIGEIGFYHHANQTIKSDLVLSDDFESILEEMKNSKLSAMMVNRKDLSLLKQKVENFDQEYKLLTTIEVNDLYAHLRSNNVNEEAYHVYVSGIDQFGAIPEYGLSDVNMILTVNPKKQKILISTIPRDTLVYNQCIPSNLRDKLTHIGNNGVSCSMQTISKFLGIEINYYIKVNFSSIEDIVNALGGIEVYSSQSFNSYDMNEEEYHFEFEKGNNQLNGVQALVFARQRHAFIDGDIQRGKNQQEVFKGILNKIKSPSIIANYDKLLNAISSNVKTSFTSNEMKSLLKNQLEKNPNWKIESQTLDGESVYTFTHSYPNQQLSTFEVDEQSLKNMIEKIKEVIQ